MKRINDGGPAFPSDNGVKHDSGMTLRDWFAGQALAGLYGSEEIQEHEWGNETIAHFCYDMADAMLKAREVKP